MESSYKIIEIKSSSPEFEPYKPLVLAFWLRGLKHGSEFFTMVEAKSYWTVYSKVIMALLKRQDCRVRVACLSDDIDTVAGFSVFEGKCVHFVFVKKDARKQGIGTALMPKSVECFTHMTTVGKSIWRKKFKKVIFNPF